MAITLLIENDTINQDNGLREFNCRAVERDEAGEVIGQSPVITRSIDAASLQAAHGGDYTRFLQERVKPELETFYAQWKSSQSAGSMKGQEL